MIRNKIHYHYNGVSERLTRITQKVPFHFFSQSSNTLSRQNIVFRYMWKNVNKIVIWKRIHSLARSLVGEGRPFARGLACVRVSRWLHAQDCNMINATSFSSSSSTNAICFFHFTSLFLMLFPVKHTDFYQNEEHVKKNENKQEEKLKEKKMWLQKSIVET